MCSDRLQLLKYRAQLFCIQLLILYDVRHKIRRKGLHKIFSRKCTQKASVRLPCCLCKCCQICHFRRSLLFGQKKRQCKSDRQNLLLSVRSLFSVYDCLQKLSVFFYWRYDIRQIHQNALFGKRIIIQTTQHDHIFPVSRSQRSHQAVTLRLRFLIISFCTCNMYGNHCVRMLFPKKRCSLIDRSLIIQSINRQFFFRF